MSEDYFILSFVDEELTILLRALNNLIDSKILFNSEKDLIFSLYQRIYDKLGGK